MLSLRLLENLERSAKVCHEYSTCGSVLLRQSSLQVVQVCIQWYNVAVRDTTYDHVLA